VRYRSQARPLCACFAQRAQRYYLVVSFGWQVVCNRIKRLVESGVGVRRQNQAHASDAFDVTRGNHIDKGQNPSTAFERNLAVDLLVGASRQGLPNRTIADHATAIADVPSFPATYHSELPKYGTLDLV
jgi:hypothetical protein